MRALIHAGARAGTALALAALALAVARWPPVEARVPLDVRALPAGALVVMLAALAALTGRAARSPGSGRVRGVLTALAAVALALVAVAALRPACGLRAEVSGPQGVVGEIGPATVEINGPRLRALPFVRRWTFRWEGPLRVEASGHYRLWATGRGRVEVSIDGRPVLGADGDALRGGASVPLTEGLHALQVTLTRQGAGPRLRLGWTRPDGVHETVPARLLGAPRARGWWWATDALALLGAALLGAVCWSADWSRRRALPAPRAIGRGELAASLAGYALLFAVMSWPLATDPVHLGVTDRPDGRLNAWILAWGGHALLHEPGRLFDAPVFHPLPDALAFSENLLLPALVVAPLQAMGPVFAYNAALFLALVASGLGAQLLTRRVSGARLAAFAAGALFAFGAHRWIRLAHLQSQLTPFLPLALLAFERFWTRRTWGRALLVGLMLGLQALTSIYVAAVTALGLAAAGACALAASLRGRDLLRLCAGLALAAGLALPLVRPYLHMRAFQGVEWTAETVAAYATTLESYAASGTRLFGPLTQAHLHPERVRDTLFPGLVPLVLGLAGLAWAPRRYRAVAVVGTLAAVTLSLGPETALYRFLHEHVLLVRGLRALSRLSLLPVLALCVLSGLALARLRWPWTLLALALGLLEATNAPLRYGRYEGPPAVARGLAGGEGAVVVLPAGEDDTRVMLDGLAHLRPLVNGDSGFVPRPYTRALELLSGTDGGETQRLLRALGVTQVVAGDAVAEVGPGAAARPVPAGAPVATLWSAQGTVASLGGTRSVEGLVFELDERPWIAAPRVEASQDGLTWTPVPAQASLADATLSLYEDPRHGRGAIVFAPQAARWLRVDPRLPAREGALMVIGDPARSAPGRQ
jgi:hypothetical protein